MTNKRDVFVYIGKYLFHNPAIMLSGPGGTYDGAKELLCER